MPPTPNVQPLPRTHRKIIFIAAIVLFACSVPVFVFYAVGYRFDFSSTDTNIKKVGGMYVSSEVQDIAIYVNDEPVENMRTFQNAAYVQNLEADMHQVHTQAEGLQTWVKELPVYAHFVTETETFNIPVVPQVRLVTEYQTAFGSSVLFDNATSTKFAFASTTNLFFNATSTATSSYQLNTEYIRVSQLVASSTKTKAEIAQRKEKQLEKRFSFSGEVSSSVLATTTENLATSTKEWNDVRLFEKDGDVYTQWIGREDRVPFYYCVSTTDASSTIAYYGEHVYESFRQEYGTSTDPFETATVVADQYCRSKIKIDRQWQSVQWFDFFPNSTDKILMHLQDGIYIVEVDDRAWQNAQKLYPGYHLEVVLDGDTIYIKDDEYYLEVFTELQGQ